MIRYITYFDIKKNIFIIDKTRIILNDWDRPCIYGGYIINKDCIYNFRGCYKILKKFQLLHNKRSGKITASKIKKR